MAKAVINLALPEVKDNYGYCNLSIHCCNDERGKPLWLRFSTQSHWDIEASSYYSTHYYNQTQLFARMIEYDSSDICCSYVVKHTPTKLSPHYQGSTCPCSRHKLLYRDSARFQWNGENEQAGSVSPREMNHRGNLEDGIWACNSTSSHDGILARMTWSVFLATIQQNFSIKTTFILRGTLVHWLLLHQVCPFH